MAPLATASPSRPSSSVECVAGDAVGFYDCYSLLHDQSCKTTSVEEGSEDADLADGGGARERELAARRSYRRMREVSFDEVISEKWGQVQRKAA